MKFSAILAATVTTLGLVSADGIFDTKYDLKIDGGGEFNGMYVTPKKTGDDEFVAIATKKADSAPYYLHKNSPHDTLIWNHDSKPYYSRANDKAPLSLKFIKSGSYNDDRYLHVKDNKVVVKGKVDAGSWYVCEKGEIKFDTKDSKHCSQATLKLTKRS
ncbi:hypothetical protein TRICI_006882 [Trichomonascus ciferrii]|uniref:Uncharacterized protein n=1 Tax=Trichomonascus ciferrii TaxID=44093 RepID=A0A6A1LNK2_9ASCO|nr:hypothetical protein TRICI_006882 [Trichomonascus ciferrii]